MQVSGMTSVTSAARPGLFMVDITFLEDSGFLKDAPTFLLALRFISLAQNFSLKQAFVHAMQAFRHGWRDQRVVSDVKQVIHEEPYRLVGGHPVLAIEAFQIHWHGKTSQRARAPQVDVGI